MAVLSCDKICERAESITDGSLSEAGILAAERARQPKPQCICNEKYINEFLGLDSTCILKTIQNCYRTLDTIDRQLLATGSPPISGILELANLSSMVGNLVCASLVEIGNKSP